MFIGSVVETFEFSVGRFAIITDLTYERWPEGLKVQIGDSVELRAQGTHVVRTEIMGIEHASPWSPKHPFVFLPSPNVTKADVPIGSEVWALD